MRGERFLLIVHLKGQDALDYVTLSYL